MKTQNLLGFAIVIATLFVQSLKANANNTITFVENGITFSVFQNGEFDFYLNNHATNVQVGYATPQISISFNSGYNYNPYVQYDQYGAVLQIENTPIYYDNYGRITRVGNINLNYAHGNLYSVGGLQIYYNNYGGYAYHRGYINHYNQHYVYHPYHNWFVRPYTGYRVVKTIPYRHHYSPVRHHYYTDHRYAYKHHDNHYNSYNYKKEAHYKHAGHKSKSVKQSYDSRRNTHVSSHEPYKQTHKSQKSQDRNKRYVSYDSQNAKHKTSVSKHSNPSDSKRTYNTTSEGNKRSQGYASKTTSKRPSATHSPRVKVSTSTQKATADKYAKKRPVTKTSNRRSRS